MGKEKGSGQQAMNRCKQAVMGIKVIVVLLIGLALVSVHSADAQQKAKIPTIGFLTAGTGSSDRVELFRQELLKLGYVERKNMAFESRNANNKSDRLPVLADELVRLKVDVIVTPGSNDTRPPRTRQKRYLSFFLGQCLTLFPLGWLTAWPALGATSRDSPP